MKKQDIFCEAMNSFAQWDKVCMWHDGSKNSYPKETWDMFCKEYNENAWKKIRMVKVVNGKRKILKTKTFDTTY